jgi:hypothetical protein
MSKRVLHIGVTVVFLGLLAAPVVGTRLAAGPKADLGDYGFRFQEVSKAVGVDFTHRAPRLDPVLEHIMPEVASMGAAVSVCDYDRDGWNDLYVVDSFEGGANRLYRNLGGEGKERFEDVAGSLGVADVNQRETGVSMGAVWGDYDNDGWEDLFLYKWGRPELFRNDAGRRFIRVTEGSGLPAWANANNAVWFDYDRDGLLDLFIGGYYAENLNLWRLTDSHVMPNSFEYATNGGRKHLMRNLGGGKFRDVAEELGLKSSRWALAAAAADLRGTGYPDLVIANDYGVTEYFANEAGPGGGRRFREIARANRIAERPKSGMNVSLGDIRNEGRFAVYISNITEEGKLIQGNNLWIPEGVGEATRYRNWAADMGVEAGGWSFGAQFGDLNNDGWQDLFLTNGYVSDDPNGSYWYDFSQITGASSHIISDAKKWPPIGNRSHSGYQRKKVWINEGGRRFVDLAAPAGVTETFDGRSVVMADLWNRGVLDVVVAHQKAPLLIYKNTVSADRRWIGFDLEGTVGNRSAIGAEVRVLWDGKEQLQQVSGGSGFCAQNQRRLHFGLGAAARVDRVLIRWPSGKEQTLEAPELGKVHEVKEPA